MSTLSHHTTAAKIPLVEPITKKWTREEYYKLDQQGWFLSQRAELIGGEIVLLSPQSFSHSWAIHAIFRTLSKTFGQEYWVRSQLPLSHPQESEPEPDVSVVLGSFESYTDHPTTAVLVVEVSLSTLEFDKEVKASLYASMDVPDYWVLDLENRQLLVQRQPVADESAPFDRRYEKVEAIPTDGHVSPLEQPEAKLAIADMLPPKK